MIWLIGDKGMRGQDLSRTRSEQKLPFIGTDREVSILEPEALKPFANKKEALQDYQLLSLYCRR